MQQTLGADGGVQQDVSHTGTQTGTRRQTVHVTVYGCMVHVVSGTCLTHSWLTIRQVT